MGKAKLPYIYTNAGSLVLFLLTALLFPISSNAEVLLIQVLVCYRRRKFRTIPSFNLKLSIELKKIEIKNSKEPRGILGLYGVFIYNCRKFM